MLRFLRTKIGISLVIALIIIGCAALLRSQSAAPEKESSLASIAIEKVIESALEKDDDQDGLKNWEETLYKSDPLDPDTDKDGMRDGDEAVAGRDPLSKSVADASATATIPVYTATDRLSQELLREYTKAKQSGKEITTDLSDRIAEEILAKDYDSSLPTAYTINDIKISADTSISGLRSYGNALGTILSAPPAGTRNELEIFQKIASEPVETYKSELLALQKRYIAMRTKLLALPSPRETAFAQADIATALTIFIESIDGALALDTDPVGSLGKISRYQDGLSALDLPFKELSAVMKKRGISFTPSESGYILMFQ
jgi:hypothetical protein